MESKRFFLFGGSPKIDPNLLGFEVFFVFTPILGEMIQFDEHIFQMG